MKKLILAALAAISIGTTSYAITAEEAIASKNWYVIDDYCKTNRISPLSFICYSNDVSFADYEIIYNSITNKPNASFCWLTYAGMNKYPISNVESLFRYSNSIPNTYVDLLWKESRYIYAYNLKKDIPDSLRKRWILNLFETKVWRDCTNLVKLAYTSVRLDKNLTTDKYCKLVYDRCKTNFHSYLLIACDLNDVDGIIEALKLSDSSITADEVNAIIEPLNAVAASYRKQDILEVLNDINSRCTIKLYDDQKTWEPILAKIRAMISVRK